jgi:inhibitor of KinA sporulation pathway (predicted exonuclease)
VKPIEIFTSLDLELNQPSEKIISIGAVVGNINTGEILDRFHIFVNPQEELAPFITKLTKIEQSDVDSGVTLIDAYTQLKAIHEKYGSFINPITWGGGDSQKIRKQLEKESYNLSDWCFGRRWIDAKTLFISWRLANGSQVQGGLAKAMTKVGLQFQGQKHNAEDDAKNTFRIYVKMLEILKNK